jgi:hypothetical protein
MEVSKSNPIESLGVNSGYFSWQLLPSSIQETREEGRNLQGAAKVPASSLGMLNMEASQELGPIFLQKRF